MEAEGCPRESLALRCLLMTVPPEPIPMPPPSADKEALTWITRRHSGCWSPADEANLAAWLDAAPDHAAAWLRAQALWDDLAGLRPLAAGELRAARAVQARSSLHRFGLALAGLGALTLVLAVLLPGSFDGVRLHQTARGEQRSLVLADGSTVRLNTATRLETDFGPACRCLRLLSGEAVFHVAHGDPRAFRVETPSGRIRDIGTEFWVRSEPAHTAVAVLEGEIEVDAGAGPVRLRAGGSRTLSGGRLQEGAGADLADLVAWRDGVLVFRDTPLPEAFREFARYHDMDFEIDARLGAYRLSGRFPSADLDGLLG
ncbi:partial Protein FecR, partial [Rhodocyclaceae bacterium]